MNPAYYTGPDIEIERNYLRLQTLRDIECLRAVRRELPNCDVLEIELAFKKALYFRLTNERAEE